MEPYRKLQRQPAPHPDRTEPSAPAGTFRGPVESRSLPTTSAQTNGQATVREHGRSRGASLHRPRRAPLLPAKTRDRTRSVPAGQATDGEVPRRRAESPAPPGVDELDDEP